MCESSELLVVAVCALFCLDLLVLRLIVPGETAPPALLLGGDPAGEAWALRWRELCRKVRGAAVPFETLELVDASEKLDAPAWRFAPPPRLIDGLRSGAGGTEKKHESHTRTETGRSGAWLGVTTSCACA